MTTKQQRLVCRALQKLQRFAVGLYSAVRPKWRPEGQSCKNCRYVDDYSDTEPPDEVNAYCTRDFILQVKNEYGGHWTHTDSWCDGWAQGPSLWQPVESPQAVAAVDPQGGITRGRPRA